jgi:hypothetical protein
MVFAIITAWLAYKRAKDNGRNGILWAIVGLIVYLGTQLLIGAVIGIFFAFGIALLDWPEAIFDDYTLPINIAAIAGAFLASWLLLKFLDRPVQTSAEKVTVEPDSVCDSPRES